MPIPDYQSVMMTLLKVAADGQEHHVREAINILANQFGLTEEERKQLLQRCAANFRHPITVGSDLSQKGWADRIS
jgi:restriction endonuclease Mrr